MSILSSFAVAAAVTLAQTPPTAPATPPAPAKPAAPAAPAAPAQPTPPVDQSGATAVTLTGDSRGQPTGWTIAHTGAGPAGAWLVSAPEGSPVMLRAELDPRAGTPAGDTFRLAFDPNTRFENGSLWLTVLPLAGNVDQGGGIIWRVQNPSNYYLLRANPLENNVRLYAVVDGTRTQLASADVPLSAASGSVGGAAITLGVTHVGDRITAFANGGRLFEVTNAAFPREGAVGVWLKSDAVSLFRDLLVRWAPAPTSTPAPADPLALSLAVEGMKCPICSGKVTKILREQPGVATADVDLEAKSARVRFTSAPGPDAIAAMLAQLKTAGYAATVK